MTKPTKQTTKEQNGILAFAVIVAPFAALLCGLAGFIYAFFISPIIALFNCRSLKDALTWLFTFLMVVGGIMILGGIHDMKLTPFLLGAGMVAVACGLIHLYPDAIK